MRENFEYIKNQAKWNAAMAYCDDKGMKFKIITEKELFVLIMVTLLMIIFILGLKVKLLMK